MDGKVVLEYSKPQIGGGQVSPVDPKVKVDGTPLTGGYISIQAETAPIDFRKIELLESRRLHGPEGVELQALLREVEPGAVQVTGPGRVPTCHRNLGRPARSLDDAVPMAVQISSSGVNAARSVSVADSMSRPS